MLSFHFQFFFFFCKAAERPLLIRAGHAGQRIFFRERVAALVHLWMRTGGLGRIAGSNPPAAMIPVCTPVASNSGMPDGDLKGESMYDIGAVAI